MVKFRAYGAVASSAAPFSCKNHDVFLFFPVMDLFLAENGTVSSNDDSLPLDVLIRLGYDDVGIFYGKGTKACVRENRRKDEAGKAAVKNEKNKRGRLGYA